jgi:translation initiation factor IF-2
LELCEQALEAEEASRSAEAKARPTAVLVVKADNHGSLKTLLDFISMIPDDEVLVKVVKTGVGEITESDVQHASEFEATIFGFNVEASGTLFTFSFNKNYTFSLFIYFLHSFIQSFYLFIHLFIHSFIHFI